MRDVQLLREGEEQLAVRSGRVHAAQGGPGGQHAAVKHRPLQRPHLYQPAFVPPVDTPNMFRAARHINIGCECACDMS